MWASSCLAQTCSAQDILGRPTTLTYVQTVKLCGASRPRTNVLRNPQVPRKGPVTRGWRPKNIRDYQTLLVQKLRRFPESRVSGRHSGTFSLIELAGLAVHVEPFLLRRWERDYPRKSKQPKGCRVWGVGTIHRLSVGRTPPCNSAIMGIYQDPNVILRNLYSYSYRVWVRPAQVFWLMGAAVLPACNVQPKHAICSKPKAGWHTCPAWRDII